MLDQIALDKYTFTRDSHLQRRRSAIYDGNPPDDKSAEQFSEPLDWSEPQSEILVETLPEPLTETPAETLITAGLPDVERTKP